LPLARTAGREKPNDTKTFSFEANAAKYGQEFTEAACLKEVQQMMLRTRYTRGDGRNKKKEMIFLR